MCTECQENYWKVYSNQANWQIRPPTCYVFSSFFIWPKEILCIHSTQLLKVTYPAKPIFTSIWHFLPWHWKSMTSDFQNVVDKFSNINIL